MRARAEEQTDVLGVSLAQVLQAARARALPAARRARLRTVDETGPLVAVGARALSYRFSDDEASSLIR